MMKKDNRELEFRDELVKELDIAVGRESRMTQELRDKIVGILFFVQGRAYERGVASVPNKKKTNN